MLDRVFLDRMYTESLERLAIDEGLIRREYDVTRDVWTSASRHGRRREARNLLRGRVLRLVVLYRNLDSSFSACDWSALQRAGLLARDAVLLQPPEERLDVPDHSLPKYERTRLLSYAGTVARSVIARCRRQFISYHVRADPDFYNRGAPFVSRRDLVDDFDLVLEHFLGSEHVVTDRKPHLASFVEDVALHWYGLRDALFRAAAHGDAVACGVATPQIAETYDAPKLLHEAECVAQTALGPAVRFLPRPRNLAEALELRETAPVRQFRSVLAEWLRMLNDGDPRAGAKMLRDVERANEALRRIRRIEEFDRSPINFWLNSIGGHVPVLSNVLTMIGTVRGAAEAYLRRRYRWSLLVHLPRRKRRPMT